MGKSTLAFDDEMLLIWDKVPRNRSNEGLQIGLDAEEICEKIDEDCMGEELNPARTSSFCTAIRTAISTS